MINDDWLFFVVPNEAIVRRPIEFYNQSSQLIGPRLKWPIEGFDANKSIIIVVIVVVDENFFRQVLPSSSVFMPKVIQNFRRNEITEIRRLNRG